MAWASAVIQPVHQLAHPLGAEILTLEPSSRVRVVSSSSAPTQAFDRLTSHDGWHNDGGFGRPIRRSGWRRSGPDRVSLRELALREPQGPLGVPVGLAVRGGASLVSCAGFGWGWTPG